MAKTPLTPATPKQLKFDLGIRVERDVGGIEMGILDNGMPYLTQRGLSTISGAARSTLQEITKEWEDGFADIIQPKGRLQVFREYLTAAGYTEPQLYMEIMKDGTPHYAYPEVVCMAFIEFFAFESQRPNPTALTNYRRLARFGLQKFIYEALHYVPIDRWTYFNDRVSLLNDSAPEGYFILFKETTGLVVDLITAGLPVNEKTIPDISVGSHWGRRWTDSAHDDKFGQRIKFEHDYPGYYPQSVSNPQKPWAYPDSALGDFRSWFRRDYLRTKFPAYVLSKASTLIGGRETAERIAAVFEAPKIEKK
jgi:hypothetical protein